MGLDEVIAKLLDVHREYQVGGGFDDADRVTPEICPLADLKEFESDFIPEIVRRVARELGQPLPKSARVKNIYVDKGRKLTIREIGRKFIEKYASKGCRV
jgi:hypothetical protein